MKWFAYRLLYDVLERVCVCVSLTVCILIFFFLIFATKVFDGRVCNAIIELVQRKFILSNWSIHARDSCYIIDVISCEKQISSIESWKDRISWSNIIIIIWHKFAWNERKKISSALLNIWMLNFFFSLSDDLAYDWRSHLHHNNYVLDGYRWSSGIGRILEVSLLWASYWFGRSSGL